MSKVRVAAYVPAAARLQAEWELQKLAAPIGPGAVLTVPLNASGSDADSVTHWGCCAAVAGDGPTVAALPALKAAFGGDYAVVSPWRSWAVATHWHGWLLARGLRVVTPAGPG